MCAIFQFHFLSVIVVFAVSNVNGPLSIVKFSECGNLSHQFRDVPGFRGFGSALNGLHQCWFLDFAKLYTSAMLIYLLNKILIEMVTVCILTGSHW